MNDTALLLDSEARPLPPWKQHPDLSPLSSAWHAGAGAGAMAGWRAAYDSMPPGEQIAYEKRYPAPLYWYWFYGNGGPGSRLMVLATFPLWMLVWALVKTIRGAIGRALLAGSLGPAGLLAADADPSIFAAAMASLNCWGPT